MAKTFVGDTTIGGIEVIGLTVPAALRRLRGESRATHGSALSGAVGGIFPRLLIPFVVPTCLGAISTRLHVTPAAAVITASVQE